MKHDFVRSALFSPVNFNTRSEAVAAIAAGFVPVAGTIYLIAGLAYRGSFGATAIADLPGLLPLDEITPDHFPGARLVDAGPMIRAAAAYAASVAPATVTLLDGVYICTTVEARVAYVSVGANPGVLTPTSQEAVVWLEAGVSLKGRGRDVTTLNCSGIPTTAEYGIAYWDYSDGETSGFKLLGRGAASGAAHGLQISLLSSDTTHINRNVTIRDLWIKDWASYGLGHQYGSPENVIYSDLIIENCGADCLDHKVRFGPGNPFDNTSGVQISNIIARNPGRRIITSVAAISIRGRAQLSNIEVTGIRADCSGIQMVAGIAVQEEIRPASQWSTLTNFYIEGDDPAVPIRALDVFSAGPMTISNGYIRGGYVITQPETTTPYGFRDGPAINNVTVEGCRLGNAFLATAPRTHFNNCRSLSEKAYFDSKRGNLVAGQTALVVPDGINVTPVVLKNGTVMASGYTVSGDTVTLSVAALLTDRFIIVQPTARAIRIETVGCNIVGGGCDEFNIEGIDFDADANFYATSITGFRDDARPTQTYPIRSRSQLVAWWAVNGATQLGGTVFSDGARQYRTIPVGHALYGTDPIPDLPGLMWYGDRTPFHFGWIGDGTEADMKRGNLALTFAGETVIDEPGTYQCFNSHPITDVEVSGDEAVSNWWAVRRCWYIGRDDVTFRIGAGVNLVLADDADAHMICIGQFPLPVRNAGGTVLQTLTHVKPQRCQVIGHGGFIDMNAAGQTPATADDYHPAMVWVQNGSHYTRIMGVRGDDSPYYGLAFESYNDAGDVEEGFIGCYAGFNIISNTLADGIDKKGFGANSRGFIIEHNTLTDCGSSSAFGSSQAAIDVRDGATVQHNTVVFTDTFNGVRVGIRAQYSDLFEESDCPTQIIGNTVIGNGLGSFTQGIRVTGPNVTTRGNMVRDWVVGYHVSSPRLSSSQDQAYDCDEGVRMSEDTAAGWQADDADFYGFEAKGCGIGFNFEKCIRPSLTGCKIMDGTTGWAMAADSGGSPVVSGVRIHGGLNLATTRLSKPGTGSVAIDDVQGFRTQTSFTVAIPVDTAGVKTVTAAHGLPFIPQISEVQVTLQGGGVTAFAFDIPPMVSSVTLPDATNVTIVAKVGTGTGVGGNTVLARVTIKGFLS